MNNAGIAIVEEKDHSNLRASYNAIFDTNVTSVAALMTAFLPLLTLSPHPRIINISSGRASLTRSSSADLPPTQVVAYSVSKTALNMLGIEFAKCAPGVMVYSANPGHCRTAFNGYRGTKDPLDGANAVVELAMAEPGKYESGFWQMEEGDEGAVRVPW